ncbi:MAG: septum formation inhibitor Maf [Gammaproteobacteria bacterium]|nr:MAG: septum formation inhibitor Maf [Gammaproteobacteria bacterium]RKZ96320.1 MAG: septum formation inhibitor Maf [Gammaproteobacteria bacterium]
MNFPTIYLASGSPRRRELLTQIGVDFLILSIDVDESYLEDETPINYVKRVAIAKAKAGWKSVADQEQRSVLGADTSVVLNNEIMGKPRDQEDARTMLQRLSGVSHQVLTAVAIVSGQQTLCELNISTVTFAELSNADIDWYLATKEGVDKAGSYAIQGLAALFIEQITGSYSGVMGLPLRETGLLLNQIAGAGNE